MRLPENRQERFGVYRNTIRSCDVSRDDRKVRYRKYRSYYMTGTDTGDRVRHNKLQEHVQFSSSYLYDPNSVRFGIALPPHYGDQYMEEEEIARYELHRIWDDSPDPITCGVAVDWAHVWDTVVMKLYTSENRAVISLVPDTGDMGVLHEDQDLWEDQEAVCHWYVLDLSRLHRMLLGNPDISEAQREAIMNAAETYAAPMSEPAGLSLPPTIERIILASASPTMVGNVQNMADSMLAVPRVNDRVVPLAELWIWDDALDDYRVVTNFLPTESILSESPNPLLKGDHPFYGLTLGPTPGYIWGTCPLEQLVGLQQWQDLKIKDLDKRDDLQIRPPIFFKGFTGITDEMAERFREPSGNITSGNPTAEIQPVAPQPLPDPFGMLDRIDLMFQRQGGLPKVLTGETTPNVRGAGQLQDQAALGAGPTLRRAMYVERFIAEIATAKLRLHARLYDKPLVKPDGSTFLLGQMPPEIRARVWAHSHSPVYAKQIKEDATLLVTHKAITPEDYLTLMNPPMAELLAAKARKLAKAQAETQEKILGLKEREVHAKELKAVK